MWGDALIIDRLLSSVNESDLKAKEEDKLVLAWEERRWARGRFTTAKGRKVGVALPTGSTLTPGAILWIGADWYLRIEAAPESVLMITPSGYEQAVRIAFEVGNRHYPLALRGDQLLVPDDKAMVRLMERLGARWEKIQTVFDPIG
ncbi:MAG: urease accessory protein UreE, partial [Candidatus Acidiferrales bacterium]